MSDARGANQLIAPDVKLGRDVRIFGFVNLYGCEIGDETKIGSFVEIQKNARIGARCKISSHTFICEGVTGRQRLYRARCHLHQRPLSPRNQRQRPVENRRRLELRSNPDQTGRLDRFGRNFTWRNHGWRERNRRRR